MENTTVNREQKKREEYVSGLRQLADFIEQNPDFTELPYEKVWAISYDRERFIKSAAALSRGGTVKKFADEDGIAPRYHCTREFGPITVDLEIDRKQVCRLVRPAREAEYECPDSLLEEAAEYRERSNG